VCRLVKCFEICERNLVPFCEVCLVGLWDVCGMVSRICERNPVPMCEGYVRCAGFDTASGIVSRICERNPVPMCEGCERYVRCCLVGLNRLEKMCERNPYQFARCV
jgi:hypothetical protein